VLALAASSGSSSCAKSSLKNPYDDGELRGGSQGAPGRASAGAAAAGGRSGAGFAAAGAGNDGRAGDGSAIGSGGNVAGAGVGGAGLGGTIGAAGRAGSNARPPTAGQAGNGPGAPWELPVPKSMLGDPGWRDSDEPLCTEQFGFALAQSVWSDSRGVFLIAITNDGNSQPGDPSCAFCPDEAMYFNSGTGWQTLDPAGPRIGGRTELTGIDSGPLILYGEATTLPMSSPCGLAMIDDGVRSCEPLLSVLDVSVVNEQLAYALLEGELLSFDGTSWGPLPQLPPAGSDLTSIWANDSVLMAADRFAGRIASLRAGSWSIENTRTTDTFSTLWGNAADDVWAGTYQGTLHRLTGATWDEVSWSGSSCPDPTIYGMWGVGETLYFHTRTTLARWNGSEVEVLLEMPCNHSDDDPRITSIWGNAADELFVGVSDPSASKRRCGTVLVLHFDGSRFHEM
jgi:hypothetical protein